MAKKATTKKIVSKDKPKSSGNKKLDTGMKKLLTVKKKGK